MLNFHTYFSLLSVLIIEISGKTLPFPNGVELNGPGIKHDKKKHLYGKLIIRNNFK